MTKQYINKEDLLRHIKTELFNHDEEYTIAHIITDIEKFDYITLDELIDDGK